MNTFRIVTFTLVAGVAAMVGCSSAKQAPDVSRDIRRALDQAGLKDVSESQNRDKGVISLGGHVSSDADKNQAESIARSLAGGQVVSNEIAILPPGQENVAKQVNSDLDKGIDSNLDAALVQDRFAANVKHSVKNGVVVLTGSVDSQAKRSQVEKTAATVPNVQQVVNELEVQDQRATSTR